jgi:predicted nucleic acid-binding protein
MIFIETWAWIALADKSDPYHRKAKALHKKFSRKRWKYVTSDNVLGETITYLYNALGATSAQGFINTVLSAVDAGTFLLVQLSPEQFRRTWEMRQKFEDKPDISFVDFTSMLIMLDHAPAALFCSVTASVRPRNQSGP